MTSRNKNLDWVDALKGFAIIGILLNHFVESYFHTYPWFSSPVENWPEFAVRIENIFPKDGSLTTRIFQFLGWLGDMCPGVFLFISGLTLTLSSLNKPLNTVDFYKKRLLRIYPLYVTIHVLIVIIAFVIFKWEINYFSPNTLFSFLGLRFTNSLFFYLNPSWWYIWLILQMYLLFPFLILLLKKKGIKFFLTTTLLITLISRISGILGYTLSSHLSFWMYGIFCGTRLFEFTFGMIIGFLLHQNNRKLINVLNNKTQLFYFSFSLYLIGFFSSWTYIGSIVSNMLITIGLSGVFFSIFEIAIKTKSKIKTPLLWIGKNSFSIFLLHQPFLIYFSSKSNGYSKFIIFILVIVFSMIAGYVIEKTVNFIFNFMVFQKDRIKKLINPEKLQSLFISSIIIFLVVSFSILLGRFGNHLNLLKLLLLFQISTFISCKFIFKIELDKLLSRIIDVYIIVSVIILILPETWLSLFWSFLLPSCLVLIVSKKFNHYISIAISLLLIFLATIGLELNLRKSHPIEVGRWGEFPALQIDDVTSYSLIPNKTTNLRYNNYNYTIHANSFGFNSPEINLSNKVENEKRILVVGDAFSMPEGVNYDYSYPALLEKKLKINFPNQIINVINAGVTGYGPNEELAQLNKYIGIIQPDIIINQLFINEYSDINYTKTSICENIGFYKPSSRMQIFLVEAQLPAYASKFFRNLFTRNYNFNYNKSLVAYYEKKSPLYNDTVISKMNTYFMKIKYLSSLWKSELIVLTVPGQIEISEPKYISYYPKNINLSDSLYYDLNLPHKFFQQLCLKNQIKLLEMKSILMNSKVQPLYFEESWHWNKDGHTAAAEYLFQFLKGNEIFKRRNEP